MLPVMCFRPLCNSLQEFRKHVTGASILSNHKAIHERVHAIYQTLLKAGPRLRYPSLYNP